jgi:hypothetical protein
VNLEAVGVEAEAGPASDLVQVGRDEAFQLALIDAASPQAARDVAQDFAGIGEAVVQPFRGKRGAYGIYARAGRLLRQGRTSAPAQRQRRNKSGRSRHRVPVAQVSSACHALRSVSVQDHDAGP